MQQNGQQNIQTSRTEGITAREAPAPTKNKGTTHPESIGPTPESQMPPHRDPMSVNHAATQATKIPFGTMAPPPIYSSAAATRRKSMGPGEKQALAGGLFVMFCLAVALAVGWWVTPAAPPSFSATDMQARDARQPSDAADVRLTVDPSDSKEMERDSYGSSGLAESPVDIKTEPVEELSVIPPASKKSPAAAQKKVDEPVAAPASSGPSASSSTAASSAKTNSAKADERQNEVQRLKSEAYSETQKDRLGSSPPAKTTPNINDSKAKPTPTRDRTAQSKRTDLSQAIAQCDREDGLFYRERCKWRLCNGKWGKYGCPSFQNEARASWQVGWLDGVGKRVAVNKKARQISLSRFRIASKI